MTCNVLSLFSLSISSHTHRQRKSDTQMKIFLKSIGSFQKLDSYKQCNSKKTSKHSGSESISQFIQSLGKKKRTAKDKRYRVWFS